MSAYSDAVLADNPYIYWRVDETSGTTVTDSSGNSRNGTYFNGFPTSAASLLDSDSNTCVEFDGSGNQLTAKAIKRSETVPDGDWTAITLECWFYADQLRRQNLFNLKPDDGTTSEPRFELYIQGTDNPGHGFNNSINWRVRDISSGGETSAGATGSISVSTRHHAVAFVSEGSSTQQVYIDGCLVDIDPHTFDAGDIGGWGVIRVGLHGGGSSIWPWDGKIDEVAIYDYVLSESQIQNHYGIGVNFTGPGCYSRDAWAWGPGPAWDVA